MLSYYLSEKNPMAYLSGSTHYQINFQLRLAELATYYEQIVNDHRSINWYKTLKVSNAYHF